MKNKIELKGIFNDVELLALFNGRRKQSRVTTRSSTFAFLFFSVSIWSTYTNPFTELYSFFSELHKTVDSG